MVLVLVVDMIADVATLLSSYAIASSNARQLIGILSHRDIESSSYGSSKSRQVNRLSVMRQLALESQRTVEAEVVGVALRAVEEEGNVLEACHVADVASGRASVSLRDSEHLSEGAIAVSTLHLCYIEALNVFIDLASLLLSL